MPRDESRAGPPAFTRPRRVAPTRPGGGCRSGARCPRCAWRRPRRDRGPSAGPLRPTGPARLPAVRERLVVVVAHPDDETLACGGLLARAAEHDLPTVVVVATDGEASHPDSPTVDAEELAGRRREELIAAVGILHPGRRLIRLGLPDGRLPGHEDTIADRLRDVVDADTILVSTCRHDAHGDHEAVAQAAADVAVETGARHLEAPIWLWYWGEPGDVPGSSARSCRSPRASWRPRSRRWRATPPRRRPCRPRPVTRRSSTPRCCRPSDAPTRRTSRPRAVVRRTVPPGAADADGAPDAEQVFEELHRGDEDPWRTASSWYESRRRALALACLPRERVGRVLEVGCSVGELTAALGERAEHVVGVDVSEAALAAAARTLRRPVGESRTPPGARSVARGLLRRRGALGDRLLPVGPRAGRDAVAGVLLADRRRSPAAGPLAPRGGGLAARRCRRARCGGPGGGRARPDAGDPGRRRRRAARPLPAEATPEPGRGGAPGTA